VGFQLHIAATRNDWVELFRQANADEPLRFYRTTVSDLESITPMRLEDIPDLGIARTGILVQEDYYLALPATERVFAREIRQNDGVIRYEVDQLTNPDSLNFWPGGLWKNDFYVFGEMSSVHKSGVCADVVKKMRRIMRKTFEYSGIFWIGPECRRLYSHCTFTYDFRTPTAWGSLNNCHTLEKG
jgi:hypothetical protein